MLYSIDIERAVLSSFLFKSHDSYLNPELFIHPGHKRIAEAINTLRQMKKPIDPIYVAEILKERGEFEEDVLTEVMAANPIINIQPYIEILKKYHAMRLARGQLAKILQNIDEGKSLSEIMSQLEEIRNNLVHNAQYSSSIKFSSLAQLQPQSIEYVCKDFIPIPYRAVSMITAPGGTGKTYLLIQLAIRAAKEGKRVACWFSEDPLTLIKERADKIATMLRLKKDMHTLFDMIDIVGIELVPMKLLHTSQYGTIEVSDEYWKMRESMKSYDVIILDPLLSFYGGDENSNTQARLFMELLNSWAYNDKKAIILSHHAPKSNQKQARGASAFVDLCRVVYSLSGNEGVQRSLEITKDNYGVAKLLRNFSIRVIPNKG